MAVIDPALTLKFGGTQLQFKNEVVFIKCYKHQERDITGTCVDCGRGLCAVCTTKYKIPICDHCNYARVQNDKRLLIKNSLLMLLFFYFGFTWLGSGASFGENLMGGLLFAGIPWGWNVLNKITPDVFLFLPLVGWFLYFLIKVMFSMMIGIFITPFKIYQIVKRMKEVSELQSYIKSGP